MKNNALRSTRGGFSLIELLVVISIIAILSSVVLVSLSDSRGKARDAVRVSDIAQLQLALALFFDRCGQYPIALNINSSAPSPSPCAVSPTITLGTFISQIPIPPAGTSQTVYGYTRQQVPSGGPIINYVLYAKLEAPNPATTRGMNAASIPTTGTWSQSVTAAPYTSCSNAVSSTDYCVGPN